jgi:peptidyl-prolyl cis-trans isomerase B (cyclophilin B)
MWGKTWVTLLALCFAGVWAEGPVAPLQAAIKTKLEFTIEQGGQELGKVMVGLFGDQDLKRTTENFRALCTHQNDKKMGYVGSKFHRVIKVLL